jgi:ribose/xylose/arabinose/galactoside ABC-type transport system permease subunit
MRKKKSLTAEGFLAILVVVVMAVIYFLGGGTKGFYSLQNVMSVLRTFSYLFVAAIGMTMIIITGNIDISFGAVISVIAIVMAAVSKLHLPFAVFFPVGMIVGALLCGLNAWLMVRFKLPSMVITLATQQIFYGALLLALDGSIYNLRANWTWFSFKFKLFGTIPVYILIALLLLAASILFFRYSPFIKRLYAIGNNRQGAIYAGIDVDKTIIETFVISGALLAFSSAILATAGNRVTCTVGNNLEMTVIAVVVVGGTSATGGSGKIYGSALGALLLAIVSPALTYMGINTYWTDLFTGAIIVLAVITSALRSYHYSFFRKNKAEVKTNG